MLCFGRKVGEFAVLLGPFVSYAALYAVALVVCLYLPHRGGSGNEQIDDDDDDDTKDLESRKVQRQQESKIETSRGCEEELLYDCIN
jgi:hypothetical protein